MSETTKRQLHLYCNDEEFEEIMAGLEKACNTDAGKIRAGDMLKNILLKFVRGIK
jgi:hypothetical protein